eukprot:1141063-Pelagomonas_calceolata.AAC.8
MDKLNECPRYQKAVRRTCMHQHTERVSTTHSEIHTRSVAPSLQGKECMSMEGFTASAYQQELAFPIQLPSSIGISGVEEVDTWGQDVPFM